VLAGLQLTGAETAEIDAVLSFCESIGLPTTLADIGLGGTSRERLLLAAERACAPGQPIHHEEGVITPERVLDAMLAADALGRGRKG
jgi:glycerol dehydrogenase